MLNYLGVKWSFGSLLGSVMLSCGSPGNKQKQNHLRLHEWEPNCKALWREAWFSHSSEQTLVFLTNQELNVCPTIMWPSGIIYCEKKKKLGFCQVRTEPLQSPPRYTKPALQPLYQNFVVNHIKNCTLAVQGWNTQQYQPFLKYHLLLW